MHTYIAYQKGNIYNDGSNPTHIKDRRETGHGTVELQQRGLVFMRSDMALFAEMLLSTIPAMLHSRGKNTVPGVSSQTAEIS